MSHYSSAKRTTTRGTRPGGLIAVNPLSGPRLAARELWVEVPRQDGAHAAWCYSDRPSYRTGETAVLFLSANVEDVVIRIYRDDAMAERIYDSGPLQAKFHDVPERAFEQGCHWPEFLRWNIPQELKSGGYIVEILDANAIDAPALGHHLLIIRSDKRHPHTIALVAATSTWTAYNDWGGASHYYGLNTGLPRGRSPHLALNRPWARGQVWLPDGAPTAVNTHRPTKPGPARYEFIEWAFIHGYTRYYAIAGWASYERKFMLWAEANGYCVDILTHADLMEQGVELLANYRCAAFVGHDEYWTRNMRMAVDQYVDQGGRVARFAGNFLWQIRLDAANSRQTSFKYDARRLDPVAQTGSTATLTSCWDDPLVGYPAATTFGVTGSRGIYAAFGGMARRAARGFNVFRPEHWAFEGTGLGYADMFGDEAGIFGFEMDGLDYTFRDGLPYPTGQDGEPAGTEILAMGWATVAEQGLPQYEDSLMLGDGDAHFLASLRGDISPEGIERNSRGSGMVVYFKRGRGEVFTAGTCEWVNGLAQSDFFTERITRNVLDRMLQI